MKESTDEIRKLMDLADSVHNRYDRLQWQRRAITLYQALGAAALVIGTTLAIQNASSDSTKLSAFVLFIPIAVLGLAISIAQRFLLDQNRIRSRTEARAIARLVPLLRETVSGISSDISPLELAEFNIRLARFDISLEGRDARLREPGDQETLATKKEAGTYLEIMHNKTGNYYFRIKSRNGQILASSEEYASKDDADAAVALLKHAPPIVRDRTILNE